MPDRQIWVASMFGYKTRQPIVTLTVADGVSVQMSPAEARDIALHLFECAEAAMSDGFLFSFLEDKLHPNEVMQATLMQAFRDYREAHCG